MGELSEALLLPHSTKEECRIPVFAGQHKVAVQKPWMNRKRGDVRYWAENGLVKWEDSNDNTYGTMTWRDAGLRALGLSQMLFNSTEQGYYSDETARMKQFICDMEQVIREAKEQGGGPEERHRQPQVLNIKPTEVDWW